jgi:hypothetical protein
MNRFTSSENLASTDSAHHRVGPEHQVEVVRHQTPSQYPHRHACTGLLDKFDEPLVVVILVKHILPRVAAIQNVVANPSDGARAVLSIAPCYHKGQSGSQQTVTKKKNVPFHTRTSGGSSKGLSGS